MSMPHWIDQLAEEIAMMAPDYFSVDETAATNFNNAGFEEAAAVKIGEYVERVFGGNLCRVCCEPTECVVNIALEATPVCNACCLDITKQTVATIEETVKATIKKIGKP